MKILVVSATIAEIEKTMRIFEIEPQNNDFFFTKQFLNNEISFLITGVGSYSMLYKLTILLDKEKFDLIVNAGIAGSFDKSLKIGDLVFVESEEIGDLGVDDNENFRTLFEQNFTDKDDFPFTNGKLMCDFSGFSSQLPTKKVKSLSLNTVGGEKKRIKKLKNKFDAQIENMEGAAFFYVCLMQKIQFIEIRAISNFVEPRNKENWQIMTAISNLNENLKILLLDLLNI